LTPGNSGKDADDPTMICCRPICVLALLWPAMAASQDGRPARPLRQLSETEHREAAEGTSRADRMRANFTDRVRALRDKAIEEGRPPPPPGTGPFEREADEIVRAYEELIERYRGSEIAAYATMRLAGFHQQLGRFDEAAKLHGAAASEFAGTSQEARIAFNTGLTHAQGRNDQVEAMKWFAQVPKPENASTRPYDEALKLYHSAQEQLIKCELKLHHDKEAKERAERLKVELPRYSAAIDRFYQFELDSRDGAEPRKPTKERARSAAELPPRPRNAAAYWIVLGNIGLIVALSGFLVFRRFNRKGGA
jgi:hypothetical protein